MSKLLENKNIIIMGVRNKWSIAWGIAEKAAKEGANLIFTCQSDRSIEMTNKLISELGNFEVIDCNVSSDESIENAFSIIKEKYGIIHGVVHAVAHAKTEDLQNDFVMTSRDGFLHALNISAYSLVGVTRCAKELMTEGGSIVTLTYLGSEKVIKNYNVMGVAKAALECSVRYLANDLGRDNIKVNAISAGPIKTLAAKGIKDFNTILDIVEEKAPLRKNVTIEDVGNTATYLLSELSTGVTGEVIHLDSGYSIMGL
ncbi:MAG TPA: NADH-specific enoyl-ACP reductase [Clostridiales bacterium]|nr:MAG: enoyl-ACP reductase [Clostridiales bacterium GWD2_32_19]HCC06892.1 NADH-specific enoyl-ACP reductase [Clostridiales bacterium]